MPNPLTDELTTEAKAELAAVFAALKVEYPPVHIEHYGGFTLFAPVQQRQPWRRSGW